MNGTSLIARACAAALLFSGVAWAEQQTGQVIDSQRLEDTKITNHQGENLGGIKRLLIDPQTGKAHIAVIGVGGFVGTGEKNVAVPWEVLQVTTAQGGNLEIKLNADKEKLANAPQFDEGEPQQLFSPEGMQQMESFWGVSGQQSSSIDGGQPFQGGQTGDQSSSPSIGTPGSYYQQNRDNIESSAIDQNNRPAGTEPEKGSISGEGDSLFRSGASSRPSSQSNSEPLPGAGLEGRPEGSTSFPDASGPVE